MGQKIQIRPARASEAKPLIGIYAESGKGKTLSALILARGFVGKDGKIIMIETESGRGEAYQGHELVGDYDVISLRGSYSPAEYGEAITVAEQAAAQHEKEGHKTALIIDSASHEWEGTGGVLHMAALNEANGKKGPLVWQRPKIDHQRHFMGRLMQTPIDLVIVCMRAKYVMEQKGKDWQRSKDLSPKQSEDILYEMFVHGWIDEEHKFRGTKYTLASWRQALRDGEMITLETGKRLLAVASGQARTVAEPERAEASDFESLLNTAKLEALGGIDAMREWWSKQPKEDQRKLTAHLDDLRRIAVEADASDGIDATPPPPVEDDIPFDDAPPPTEEVQAPPPPPEPEPEPAPEPKPAPGKDARYELRTAKGVKLADFGAHGFISAVTGAINKAGSDRERKAIYQQNSRVLATVAFEHIDLKDQAEDLARRWGG